MKKINSARDFQEEHWQPWRLFRVKLSFLVVVIAMVILWSSTSYAPSAPEDFDRATQPLEVLRFVQRSEAVAVRRVGFGTVRIPPERLLTTVLFNVETWHSLSGGSVDKLEYDMSVILAPDFSYTLLYFDEDPRKVAVCYQGRYRMYRLPEPAYETMLKIHSTSSTLLAQETEALPVPLVDPLPEPFIRLGTLADGSRLFYRSPDAPWPLDVPWPTLTPYNNDLTDDLESYEPTSAIGPGAVALKTPEGHWQLLSIGMPSLPIISPDKRHVAWIDNAAFEVIGRPWVYAVETLSMRQVMPIPYDFEPVDDQSVKQLLWQDNEHLAMILGYGYGTVSQGGDVYRVQLPKLRSQRLYQAYNGNREEAVALKRTRDGGIETQIVRWVDDNFLSYFYFNQRLEPLYPMGTSEQ